MISTCALDSSDCFRLAFGDHILQMDTSIVLANLVYEPSIYYRVSEYANGKFS
jgi:hypothetical protein